MKVAQKLYRAVSHVEKIDVVNRKQEFQIVM